MLALFVIAADVAVVATVLAVTARVTLHALLFLAVSLLGTAVVFYTLGAPFAAALQVIVYAGAIVVLILFAAMLLSPAGDMPAERERAGWQWLAAFLLAAVLLAEIVVILVLGDSPGRGTRSVPSHQVGEALFSTYALAVELASTLLLVALIGVRHLAARIEEGASEDEPGEGVREP
jgi:NADH-quinone oxidoreductase subunit J